MTSGCIHSLSQADIGTNGAYKEVENPKSWDDATINLARDMLADGSLSIAAGEADDRDFMSSPKVTDR